MAPDTGVRARSGFGELLRTFRMAAGLSQEALAERAGLSAGGISVLERGARREPHRDTVMQLAQAIALSPGDRTALEQSLQPARPRRRNASLMSEAPQERHNSPWALTSLVGRERDSAAILDLIATQRLITLTGAGGVGKTRLAVETAREALERFPDGVWLVELTPLADAERVASTVADALGMRLQSVRKGKTAGSRSSSRNACSSCSTTANMSSTARPQSLNAFSSAARMFGSWPRVASRCGCAASAVLRVDPLELPRTRSQRLDRPDDSRVASAIAIFVDRAREVDPSFSISANNCDWRTLEDLRGRASCDVNGSFVRRACSEAPNPRFARAGAAAALVLSGPFAATLFVRISGKISEMRGDSDRADRERKSDGK